MSFLLRRPVSSLSPLTKLPLSPSITSTTSSLLTHHLPLPRPFSTSPTSRIAKITIVGRLAAEPEEVPTSSGNSMIRYALGTSTGPKDNRTTSWWKVACFPPGQGVKDLMMGLGKGSLVYVEGEASMRKFTNSENQQQQALSIVQRQIDVLEKREPGGSSSSSESSESERE